MAYDRIIALKNDKTVYHHGDKCIKVFSKDFKQSAVFEECLNLCKAKESTSVCVPKPLGVFIKENGMELVTEYVEGKTLAQSYAEDKSKGKEIIEELVGLQTEVQLQKSPFYPLEEKQKSRGLNLCQANVIPENIIKSESGKLYLTGWSRPFTGSYKQDSAISFLLIKYTHGEELANLYLEIYCNQKKIAVEEILKQTPFAISFLANRTTGVKREYFKTLAKNIK